MYIYIYVYICLLCSVFKQIELLPHALLAVLLYLVFAAVSLGCIGSSPVAFCVDAVPTREE